MMNTRRRGTPVLRGGERCRGRCSRAHAGARSGHRSCREVSYSSVLHNPMAPLTGCERPGSLLYRNDVAHRDGSRSREGSARADGGDH